MLRARVKIKQFRTLVMVDGDGSFLKYINNQEESDFYIRNNLFGGQYRDHIDLLYKKGSINMITRFKNVSKAVTFYTLEKYLEVTGDIKR